MYGIKFDEIKSNIDMCEWLHDIGWRAPCDAQWEKIKPLYERLAELEAENARLREALQKVVNKVNSTHEADPPNQWDDALNVCYNIADDALSGVTP